MKNYKLIILITFLGGLFRFIGLGDKALWTDEALYGFFLDTFPPVQEYPTVLIGQLLGLHSEFELRFMSALTGTLTIPAVYFVLKDKNTALYASLFVAFCPLFVFWSRLARPYAFSGLFLVLGWRSAWFYVVAIATTPIALIGVRVFNQKWTVLVSAVIGSAILYFIREDSERFLTFRQLLIATVSALTVIFLAYYYKDKLKEVLTIWRVIAIVIVCVVSVIVFREEIGLQRIIQQALISSRWFYLPTLAGVLYFFDYVLREEKNK